MLYNHLSINYRVIPMKLLRPDMICLMHSIKWRKNYHKTVETWKSRHVLALTYIRFTLNNDILTLDRWCRHQEFVGYIALCLGWQCPPIKVALTPNPFMVVVCFLPSGYFIYQLRLYYQYSKAWTNLVGTISFVNCSYISPMSLATGKYEWAIQHVSFLKYDRNQLIPVTWFYSWWCDPMNI